MNMNVHVLKSKIHRAIVTQAELDYFGSITIDEDLMNAAEIRPYEKVLVTNMSNGARLETYALKGEAGSGVICLNGPSAHLCCKGDEVLIMTFAVVADEDIDKVKPVVIFPDKANKIREVAVLD
jgi:aspartate 1-decarboxylase